MLRGRRLTRRAAATSASVLTAIAAVAVFTADAAPAGQVNDGFADRLPGEPAPAAGDLERQVSGEFVEGGGVSFPVGEHTFRVPDDITSIEVVVSGAAGGDGGRANPGAGGLGGRVTATIAVTPGETLDVVVGAFAGGVTPTFSRGGDRSLLSRGSTPLVIAGGGGGGASGPAADYTGTALPGGDGGPGGGTDPGGDGQDASEDCAPGLGGDAGSTGGAGGAGGAGDFGNGSTGGPGTADGDGGTPLFNGFFSAIAGDGGDGAFGGGAGGNGGLAAFDVLCSSGGGGGGSNLAPTGATSEAGVQEGDGAVAISWQQSGQFVRDRPEAVVAQPTFTG